MKTHSSFLLKSSGRLARGLKKAKSSAFILSVTGVYILAPHFAGSAATYTWNGGGGSPSDGSGTWDSTTSNWWNGGSVAWTNSNAVQFGVGTGGATAYTVTLSSTANPTVSGITFANNYYTLTGGTISLGASGTTGIAVNTGSATIASVLSGAAALGYSGTGTLILNGNNTFSGGTWINAGVLRTGTTTALGSGTATVASGATLDLNGYAPTNAMVVISGSGTTGQGAVITNSGSPGVKLTLAANAAYGGSARMDLNAGLVGNNYALTKTGAGSSSLWTDLNNNNTLSAFNVQQGSVYFENGNTTATTTFNVANGATLGFWGGGTLASPEALIAPVVAVGGAILANIGGGSSSSYDAFAGPVTVSGTVSLNPNGVNLMITGSVTGTGGLNNINAGGVSILSGSNSYSGGSTASSGALEFTTPNSMPASGTATGVSGGSLAVAIGGSGQFTTGTSGAGSIGGMLSGIGGQGGPVTWVSGMALGIDTTAGSGTYAGVMSNPGAVTLGITKLGANTLTLTGSSNYTGTTTVSGGVLAFAPGAAIGGTASALAVNNGAQLSVTNGVTVTTSASISVIGAGSIYLETGGLINTVAGATVNLMGAGSTSGTLTSSGTGIGGTLDLHGSSLYITPNNTNGALFTFNNVVVQNVNDFELARGGGTRTVTLQNGAQLIAKSMTVSVDASSGDTLNVNSGSILNLSGATLNMHGGSGNADIVNINGGNVINVSNVTFDGATRGWESIVISNSGQLSSSANSDINCVSGTVSVTGTGSYWNMNGATLTIGAAVITGSNTSQGNLLTIASGGLVSTGGLILGSTNNWVTLNSGTLAAGAAGNLISGSGYAYVRSGGAILDSGGFNTTVSVPIVTDTTSTGGGLTKNGSGTLTLTGTNTYAGATTINAGTLESAKVVALNTTSAITVNNAGTLAVNFGGASDYAASDVVTLLGKTTFGATTTAFAFDTTNLSGTYGNALTMAAGLAKLGSNTLTLTGTSTYTGATTISGGILQIADGVLPSSSVITNNAALVYTPVINSGTCPNTINGTGTLTVNGSNTLTLSGSNSYTGATTISSGTLILAGANAVQNSIVTSSVANGLVFNSGIGAFNFGGLSGSSSLALTDAGGAPVALSVGGNTGSPTYSGVLSGSGSLTQSGIGTLTLTGSNTYTGATIVANGGLTVNGTAGSLANTSGLTVTGATLNLGDNTNGPAGSINPAASVTLGGVNGGGALYVNRISSGTIGQQASVASLTVGVGYSFANAGVFSGSIGALNITGFGVNYTRLPGGIYNSGGGGGNKSTAFVNTPAGSVIGIGSNAILIGAVGTGAAFGLVPAVSGVFGGATMTNDTYASGVNTTLTLDTALATGTTQSLVFTTNVAKTLKLNGTLTVESGGIILGQGLTGAGNITGTGSLKAPSGQDLWIGVGQNSGACDLSTISATVADDGASTGLTKFGAGTLLLSGSNTFSGPIYLDAGVLAVGNANALGQGTGNLNFLGSTSFGANVTLQASGVGFTSARNIVIGGGITGAVIDTNGQNVTLSGLISNGGTPSTNSTGALVKMSLGTLTLNGTAVNTYNGSTAVNGGTLKLDFGNLATPTNLLNNSTSLILGGGSLSILGKSTGTTSQTLTNLTLAANTGSGIVLNPNGGAGTTLTFSGSVTRNAGATLNVDLSAGGAVAANLAAGTLGYATVKDATGTGFAKATGSALQRQTAFTILAVASSASATDFISSPAGSSSTGSPYLTKMGGSFSANTLTIDTTNATGANFLDLGGASNVLTLTQKGLLMLGGNNFTIQDGQVGASGVETILHTMGSGTLTISALVGSGGGYLTKNGTGTLLLAGANTYTGATSIVAGLAQAGVDSVSTTSGAFGTSNGGSVTVNLGAALDFNGHAVNKNLILNGNGINGGGALLNSGSTAGSSTGTVNLTGSSTIVSAGFGGLTVGGAVTNSGYALTVDGAGATTLSGIVSGVGSLIKNGTGNLILNGANSFSGGVILNSGTLGLGNASALGSISNIVAINGGTVDVAINSAINSTMGTLLLNNDFATTSSGGSSGAWTAAAPVTLGKTVNVTANAAGGTTFSGVISDAGNGYGLTKSGTGTMTLTGANTYSGTTTISGGVLQITSDAQLGAVPASPSTNIVLNGGELENNNSSPSLSVNRNVTLTGSGGFIEAGWSAPFTVNGQISGSGSLGVVWNTGITVLSGSNNYAGATTIGTYGNGYYNNAAANPTLWIGNNNALPGGDLVFGTSGSANTATLDMRGFNATVGALTGGTNALVNNLYGGGTYTLTVGNNNASSTFTGAIKNTSGAIALVKTGTGTLLLNGSNGYTGTTTVNGGTLQIGDGANGALATASAVTVNSGGTLALNLANSGTFGSQIYITGGAVNLMTGGTSTLSGYLGGWVSGVINQSGTGTTIIAGNNQFYGTTNINSGVVQLGAQNGAYDSTVNVAVNNGLTFGVNAATVGGLSGSGSIVLVNGTSAVTLTAGQNNANTTYSGVLSGSGSLVKVGTGALTLTGSNTFTGTTTISSGTLALGAGIAFGGTTNGLVSVAGGALSIPSGAVLTTAALAVTGTGAIYLENGGLMNAYATTANGYSYLTVNGQNASNTSGLLTSSGTGMGGTLDLHNSNFVVEGWNSGNYQFAINNVTVQNGNEFELGRGGSGHVLTLQNGAIVNAKSMTLAVDSSNDTLNVTSGATLNLSGGNLNMHGGGWGGSTLNINGGTVTNVGAVSFSNGASNRSANSVVISNGGQLSSTLNSDINCVSGSTTVTGTGSLWNMNAGTLSIGQAVTTGTNTGQGNSLTVANGGQVTTGGLILGSTNNWVTIDGGAIAAGANGNLMSGSGYAYVRAGGAVLGSGTFSSTVSVPIVEDPTSTGGGVTKNGSGTLTLTGSNSYTGGSTVSSGTLRTGNVNALGTGSLTINGGTLDLYGNSVAVGTLSGSAGTLLTNSVSGTATLSTAVASGTSIYSGNIVNGTGAVVLFKSGSGTLTLTGNSTGGVTVNGGTLQIGDGLTSGVASSGALSLNSGATLAVNLANGGGLTSPISSSSSSAIQAISGGTNTIAGNITGASVFNQNGTGTTILTGINTFTGATSINSGVLQLSGSYAANESTINVGVNNGLTFGTNATIVGGISGSGNVALVNGTNAVALTVGNNSLDSTYSGSLSGPGSLTKTGLCTLTLTGSSAYSGTTSVIRGTLALSSGAAMGGTASGLLVSNGAQLSIANGAVLTTSANLNVVGSGAIYLENGGRIDTAANTIVALDSSLTNNTSGTLTSSGTGVGGILNLHNSALYVGAINANNYQFTFNNVIVQNVGDFELGRGGAGQTATLSNGAQLTATGLSLAVDASTYTLNVQSSSVLSLGTGGIAMHFGASGTCNNTLNINGGSVTTTGAVNFFGDRNDRVAGSIVITNGGTLSSAAASNINAMNSTLSVSGAGSSWNMNGKTLTIGAAVSGSTGAGQGNSLQISSGGLVTSGSVVLASASNSVVFDGGTLAAAVSGTLISGAGFVDVRSTGAAIDTGTNNVTVASTLVEDDASTGGGLTKAGAGMLTLTGSNSYSGGTRLSNGTLKLGNANALGTGGLTVNAGTLDLYGNSVSIPAFSGAGGTVTNTVAGTATLTANISGTSSYAGVIAGGAGFVALSKSGAGTLMLSGSNSHSGGTTVSNGTLQIGSANALGTGGLTVNGGTLDLYGNSVSVTGFSGAGGAITNTVPGSSTLITNVSGSSTYAGNITDGAGSVIVDKQNAGELILSGSIQMTGLTAEAGSVQLTQSGSIGTVALYSGATVSMAAHSGSTYNVLNISSLSMSGFTVSPSTAARTSALNADSLGSPAGAGMLTAAGQSQNSAATSPQTAIEPASPEAVPEPGVFGLLTVAAMGLIGRRSRKQRSV